MKLIFKYMKPYLLSFLLIIGFTFLQVQTELKLPDYMSNIVTNGIQYSGVVEEVPKAITKKDMNLVLEFSQDDKKILSCFSLIDKGTSAVVLNKEIQFNEDVYILDENKEINDLLLRPLAMAYESKILNTKDIKIIEENLDGLQDNIGSIVRLYIKDLYNNVGLGSETIQNNYILSVGLKMLGVSVLGVIATLMSTYLATYTAAKIAANLRSDLFKKIESFSSSEFSKFSTSSLITRTGNDITKTQQLIQMMSRMMLMAPMMGITAVIKVIKYPNVSWILVVAIGIILATMIILLVFAVPKFTIIQRLVDKINTIVREFLDGMLVIRAFNSEDKEENKFKETNDEYKAVETFVNKMLAIVSPMMTIIMNGLSIAIIWFSAKQIDIDAMTIGDMMAFSQYAMHVVISFTMVSVTFFMIPRSLVSVKRIQEVLDTENTILDPDEPKVLPEENGILAFNNVTFKYPGAEECVLENINFEAKPGETVAFIGSTGSGKSTIVKLIPRLFDVTEGSITYCGLDLRQVKQKDLHEKIGFISQKAVLFTGDIKSNIEFGRQIDEDSLNQAIDISQTRNIVDEYEQGIYTPISQGGTNVSGGQKQRISIARALAQNKSIYIFDDSFSALDYETDKKLRKELNKLIEKTKSTVIIVAQRISTIKNADKIVVLNEGKIVGEGKHQDLLKNCDVYKQIAFSQLSKEELA